MALGNPAYNDRGKREHVPRLYSLELGERMVGLNHYSWNDELNGALMGDKRHL